MDHPILSQECSLEVSGVSQITSEEESSAIGTNKTGKTTLISDDLKTSSSSGQLLPGSSQSVPSKAASVSGVYASSADPVLMPSLDPCNPGEVGIIKRVVGSQRTVVEMTNRAASRDISGPELSSVGGKGPSAISHSSVHGRVQIRSQGSRVNQLSDASHPASSSLCGPPGSRLSSTYSSRSQQLTDSQKGIISMVLTHLCCRLFALVYINIHFFPQ